MSPSQKILIVGHRDVIPLSILQSLKANGYRRVSFSAEIGLDVLSQSATQYFFDKERPDYVFLCSLRSGGIAANQKHGAEFIYENLHAQNNIIHHAYKFGVKKLMYIAGSCVYPKECPQPMKEQYLLTGPVEPTSEPYSVAKIAGVKLCQAYKRQYGFNAIVVVPATVYGPGSETDMETAHVMGALIGKFHEAVVQKKKEVEIWGSGRARREFLYADDFTRAVMFLMDRYNGEEMINLGSGQDVSIKKLAAMIKKVSGFKGKIVFDRTKPDGAMKKLLDSRRILKMRWTPNIGLERGIKETWNWYLKQKR